MASFKMVHLSIGLASATLCLPARGPAKAGHHSSCGPPACFPAHAPSLETTMYYMVNTSSPLSLEVNAPGPSPFVFLFCRVLELVRPEKCLTMLMHRDARRSAQR